MFQARQAKGAEARRLARFRARLACAVLALASVAAQGNVVCSGPVVNLAVNPQSGNLTVLIPGGGNWYQCSFAGSQGGVAPESCRVLYATLAMAIATGRRVAFYFSDGWPSWTENTSYCASVGHWAIPNPYPYYFTLVDY